MTNSSVSTTFNLGGDLSVNRLGYGAMRLTGQPGNFGPYADWAGGKQLRRGAPLAQAEGVLAQIAQTHDANPTQIALAWLLHRAPNILLIPGTTTVAHLEDNIQAASISLSNDEIAQLSAL
ncbi:MAG: aldo/keto reductase [Cyanobacteria bacterium P01_H01_bin.105]